MKYGRFLVMILTSTAVMFGLMYLNTFALSHVFFSQTRFWMALVMGAAMAIVMLSFMLHMYEDRRKNVAIYAGAVIVFAAALWLVRSQQTVDDVAFMKAMIPHHSIAVMTSERAHIRDARTRELAQAIVTAQRREIAEMKYLIAQIERHGVKSNGRPDGEPGRSPGNDREATLDPERPAAPIVAPEEALAGVDVRLLQPEIMTDTDLAQITAALRGCIFRFTRAGFPAFFYAGDGSGIATLKLNGRMVQLRLAGPGSYEAGGIRAQLRMLEAGEPTGPTDAELVVHLPGTPNELGYHGVAGCSPAATAVGWIR